MDKPRRKQDSSIWVKLLCLVVLSCWSSAVAFSTPKPKDVISVDPILGDWNITVKYSEEIPQEERGVETYRFTSAGELIRTKHGKSVPYGSFQVMGNRLRFTYGEDKSESFTISTLTNEVLKLTQEETGEECWFERPNK